MPDFVFTIKTPAELAGVEAAIKSFEQLRGKAKANGQDFAELDRKIAAATASVTAFIATAQKIPDYTPIKKLADESERYQQTLQKMESAAHEARAEQAQLAIDQANAARFTTAAGSATDEAAEKTKLFSGHSNELKKVIQELSREFPIAGLALKAFASPIGATLTVAIGFFVAIKRQIDETNSKLDEMADRAAKPLASFAENFRNAQNAATEANREFQKGLDALAENASEIGKDADAAVAKLQRYTVAQIELNNAAKAAAIAQVNRDEELGPGKGGITQQEAIKRRSQINNFYDAEENKTRSQGEGKQVSVLNNERASLAKNLTTAQTLTGPGEADVLRQIEIANKKEVAANALRTAEELKAKSKGEAQKKVDEAQKALDAYKENPDMSEISIPGLLFPKFGQRKRLKLEKSLQEAQDEQGVLDAEASKSQKLGEGSAEDASALVKKTKGEEEANILVKSLSKQLADKDRRIAELQEEFNSARSVREQILPLKQQERAFDDETQTRKVEERQREEAEREKKRNSPNARKLGQEASRDVEENFKSPVGKPFGMSESPAIFTPPNASSGTDAVAAAFQSYHATNLAGQKSLAETIDRLRQELADSNSQGIDRTLA